MKTILTFSEKFKSFLNSKGLFALTSCALYLLTVHPAYSHVHSSHSHSKDNLRIAEEIIAQAFALAPEVTEMAEGSLAQAYTRTNASPYIPFITVGEKSIPINSNFWNLVRGWIRLYRHEIEHYCPCDINEEELIKEAKDHIAKGFLRLKVGEPLAHLAEHGTLTLYGYAGRYGRAYATILATLEVAEHSISFLFGGKGIGFLCNFFQVTLFFLLRKAQIYTRALLNSNTLGENQLLTILRTAFLNRIMKNAERNVFFLLETVDINEEALATVNEEGAGKKNNRARWVHTVSKKAKDVLQQIDTLDTQLENEELSDAEREKLFKKRAKLYKKMEKITKVSTRKSFLGKRYKRWLLLLSRKGQKTYLKGTTYADTTTTDHWLRHLSIEEMVLERALTQEAEKSSQKTEKTSSLKPDEIRTFLAKEFVEKMKQQHPNTDEKRHVLSVERVLTDIENIFDPSLTMRERYLLTLLVETVLTGFFEHHLRLIYNRLAIPTADLNIWQRIKARAKLRGRLEPFIQYAFIYSDFLRTVSLINNKVRINPYKYEAMGNLLIFFEHLNQLSQIARSNSTQEQIIAAMDQSLHRIKSAQAHREKSTIRSWIPFRVPLPWCRNLVRL